MDASKTIEERRGAFVRHLYGMHHALSSENPRRASEARRQLALLRRSFAGPPQEAEAYDIVFPHDPPLAEQEIWLLVAGLYALHPHSNTSPGRSIGGAMQLLTNEHPSAKRRFTQLLSVDHAAMPHYLRQTIRLLRSVDVAIDYHLLLADLVMMRSSSQEAHRVRLRWAREFHRPIRAARNRKTATSPEAGRMAPSVTETMNAQEAL